MRGRAEGGDVGIERQLPSGRRKHGARAAALAVVLTIAVAVAAPAASSVTLGSVTITLLSSRYYPGGNYTRFAYEARGTSNPSCAYWVLGSCTEFRDALWWTSGAFEWTTSPLVGLKITPSKKRQTFNIDAAGRWNMATVPVGVQGGGSFLQGWIDGPACGASSLSIEVVAGGGVAFPPVTGAGLFPARNGTMLRIQSSSAGWTISPDATFMLPAGASEAVVARVLEISVGAHSSQVGTTDVSVDYALRVSEADLYSLPQGTYEVTITYTVALD